MGPFFKTQYPPTSSFHGFREMVTIFREMDPNSNSGSYPATGVPKEVTHGKLSL
jgi:hypothetical protein